VWIDERLAQAVAARFEAVNGRHEMTLADDEYVSAWYAPLEEVASADGVDPDELRRLMLANRLPLPSYIRRDGAQMVPRALLELPRAAGGVDRLRDWFAAQWETPADAVREWDEYLSGQYVCLRDVTPAAMRRKNELVAAISAALDEPDPAPDALHTLVDELDELEPPFAPYDRLRFGGPVSRDRLIDEVRLKFPRAPG
jgi:hypothetical protein